MLRNGEHVYTNGDLAVQEFANTLQELKSLGITPIIFAPPPTTQQDVGRCLTSAEWMGIGLEQCDFPLEEIRPGANHGVLVLKCLPKTTTKLFGLIG